MACHNCFMFRCFELHVQTGVWLWFSWFPAISLCHCIIRLDSFGHKLVIRRWKNCEQATCFNFKAQSVYVSTVIVNTFVNCYQEYSNRNPEVLFSVLRFYVSADLSSCSLPRPMQIQVETYDLPASIQNTHMLVRWKLSTI